MELSEIPAPWACPKTLHFVYTIVIPSTSRDRSPVIHFRGVTLIYTARGLGLYFPKDFPKFGNEKYQSGLISRGLGYRGPRGPSPQPPPAKPPVQSLPACWGVWDELCRQRDVASLSAVSHPL